MQDFVLAAGVPEYLSVDHTYCANFASANKPSEGIYESCFFPQYAMNRRNDVILAQAMSDESLWPDDGAPVQIIRGYVGGRCTNWLQKI